MKRTGTKFFNHAFANVLLSIKSYWISNQFLIQIMIGLKILLVGLETRMLYV